MFKFLALRAALSFAIKTVEETSPRAMSAGYVSSAGKMSTCYVPPPDCVRGMTQLDRSKFTRKVQLPLLMVKESAIDGILPIVKAHLFKIPRFKPIQNTFTDDKKVYLNPTFNSFHDFSAQEIEAFSWAGVGESNFSIVDVELNYDNFKVEEIISAVLPEGSFSSYSSIGHVVHVNLKPELSAFKHLIGTVLLDKISHCRTVVNKTEVIDNEYRNFPLEIIAGSGDLKSTVKENNCTFELDISEVYWNPRLGTEHKRIISKLNRCDVVYDLFCGVGPFSIPAAKLGCEVLANDLNPAAIKWLEVNKNINRIGDNLRMYSKDANAFLTEDVREHFANFCANLDGDKLITSKIHVIMNLPATSCQFVPALRAAFNFENFPSNYQHRLLNLSPMVHLYCFTSSQEAESCATRMLENAFGTTITLDLKETAVVRSVAPNKEMVRVTFALSQRLIRCNVDQLQTFNLAGSEENHTNANRKRGAEELEETVGALANFGEIKRPHHDANIIVTEENKNLQSL